MWSMAGAVDEIDWSDGSCCHAFCLFQYCTYSMDELILTSVFMILRDILVLKNQMVNARLN